MSNQAARLVTELLQPQTIEDLLLSGKDIRRLEQMVSQGSVMNMIFHGGTGTGKTTACKIILKTVFPENGVEFRGAVTWNVDKIAQIESYAASSALLGRKACLIDEVDLLPKKLQNALRSILDKTSKNTPFLFTANDIKKVLSAIQSRTLLLSFDVAPSDCAEVLWLHEVYHT